MNPLFSSTFTFNIHAFPPLVTALAILLLGLIVVIREKGSRVSLLYLSYTLAASGWMFCAGFALLMSSEVQAYRWMKFANAWVTIIPAALYHFSAVVLEADTVRRRSIRAFWAISLVFLGATLLTDALFDGLNHYSWGIFLSYRWPSYLFMCYFLLASIATLRLYWTEYRRADRNATKHGRAKAFLVAFSIGYLGTLDFLPAIGVPYYPISSIPMIAMLILVSRAIWRYRLEDITPAFAAKEIIETMNDAVIVLDRDGVVRVLNKAACSLLECRDEDLLGKTPGDCPGPCRPLMVTLQAVADSGPVRNLEVLCSPPNPRTVSLSTSIMRNVAGEHTATVCLVNDVTDRKRSEESLLLFRNLLDRSTDAIFVNDPATGRFLMVNDKACSTLGYAREELLSLSTIEVESKFPDRASWDAHVREVRARGYLILEGSHKRSNGTLLPVEVSVTYMTLGGRDYMVAVARDISERKTVEAALRTSEERLAKAQRMAHVGNWEMDLITGRLWWSDEVYRIYGMEPGSIVPTMDLVERTLHNDDRARFLGVVQAAVDGKGSFETDYRLVRPDNTVRTVHTIGKVSCDKEGRPAVNSGTVQDVTEQRQAESERELLISELQGANEKLQSLDKIKTNFISMVSHELRTPLTTIKAFVELILLKQQMPEEQKRKLMTTVNVEADRLGRLIADLLDLARIESGTLKMQKEQLSLEPLLRDVITGMTLLFEKKRLDVSADFGTGPAVVAGDRDRLVQVVTNILSNAVKFTPQGGAIRVGLRREQGAQPQAVVEISDTGVGIAAADLERIFEKFHRSDDTHRAGIEGTGLGLAITREIVEHHGGNIWAASTYGKGSTFTFTLPLG